MSFVPRAHCLLVATCLVAACDRTALGPPPPVAHLRITNPDRMTLSLAAAQGDAAMPRLELGAGESHTLDLVAGAYMLHAQHHDGHLSLPVPLFANALPADATLHVTVAPPPHTAPPAGFVRVPAGPALVGDTLGVGQEDERPARIVDVPAFLLGAREVSNQEFAAFLTAAGRDIDPAWCAFDSRKFRCTRGADGTWSSDAPDLPVVTVSLAGARAYCDHRTRATGVRHRLPTEVEWEKAARGPESFVFAYGNVYRRAAANQESGTLRPCGAFAPNGFGLFDMTGNAFEWTSDEWRDAARPSRTAPGEFQVLRGGSFVLDGMYLRNSFRMRQRPDVRTDDIGLRVACDLVDTRSTDR